MPTFRGLELGVTFGLLVSAGMIALYYGLLRDTPIFAELTCIVRRKMSEFGVDSPLGFWSFAVFLSIFHSLFEEYYWRWFVFGWLRGDAALGRPALLPLPAALIVSGLAFMAHHSILLWVYFPGNFWTAVVPFSLCVAGGGIAWVIRERLGNLALLLGLKIGLQLAEGA